MKKVTLLLALVCLGTSFAQTLTHYDDIKLNHAADYKAADSFALMASNSILATPVKKDNIERDRSLKFLVKCMAGTPDYCFSPDAEILKGNEDLTGIYLACLAKYSLENKPLAKNKKLVKLNAVKLLINYCSNPRNNVEMNSYLKKLAEANQKGELEKLL